MATSISINAQQLGLRLLELPSELVELLESETAPVLQLKSLSATSPSSQTPANVVLCTRNKSYEVRQVQSSNVLYILQQSPDSGLTAISQCKGMLELVPCKADAIEYIRQTLPEYTEDITVQSKITREEFFADAPFSKGELEDALLDLCVFEKDASLWIAAPGLLLTTWKSLLTAVTIQGVQLDHYWDIRNIEYQLMEDDVDLEIFHAIVLRLDNCPRNVREAMLDARYGTAWVGRLVLDCEDESMPKGKFITQWQDLLPESWRLHASLDLIKGEYTLLEDGSIMIKHRSITKSAPDKPAIPPKSKWHQKFRK